MMGYAVGVDFGSVLSKACIAKWDNDFPLNPERVRVAASVPSVAYVNSDNELIVGELADRWGEADPQRVIRDFKRRLGDPVPIMVGEWAGQTEHIVASVIANIVDDIATAEGGRPDAIGVSHPASWGAYKQELLSGALTEAGLTDVTLVSEPEAAATNTARVGPCAGRTVVVYDLGGGSFEAAVMVRVGDEQFKLRGHSQALDWLGGSDFDQAIFSRVRQAAGLTGLETTDKDVLASLRRLRGDCTVAKELLSIDTEATVSVVAGGRRSRIRLVRSEFEELIRDAIDDTVDTTRRAITSAGIAEQDIDAIVLTGGSSRIPLVAQVISAEFSLPIVIDATPEASTSLGAAWHALAALRARSAPMVVCDAPGVVDPPMEQIATPIPNPALTSAPLPPAVPVGAAAAPALSAPLLPAALPPEALPPGPVHEVWELPPAALPPAAAASPNPSAPQPNPPAVRPAPALPSGGSGGGPAGRRDQRERHGRHRRRGIRRYWIRVAGVIVAVAGTITAGSAITTSQASDRNSPNGDPQANIVSTPTTSPSELLPAGQPATEQAATGRAVTQQATGPAKTGVSSAHP